jgi:hypothetical protein
MRYVFNTFTLEPEEVVQVRGSNSLYSLQNTSSIAAILQGSNTGTEWVNVVTVVPNSANTVQSAFKYLKVLNSTLHINRASNITVDNSGGGGTVTNRYAGEWDLSIGTVGIGEAVPDPSRSTGFLKITDDMFSFIGDTSPLPLGSSYMDGVMANGASTTNSGLRSAKALWPSIVPADNFMGLMLGVTRNDVTLQNIVDFLMTGVSSVPINGVLFLARIQASAFIVESYLFEDSAPLESGSNTFPIPASGGIIYWGIDTNTGVPFISVEGDTRTSVNALNLSYWINDTFSPSYSVFWNSNPQLIVANPSTFVFDLGTTEGGRLPFLSESIVPTLPPDAADGKVYEIVGANGVYAGNQLNQGDFVEFANSLQKLIVTSKPKTTAQLGQIAQERILVDLQTNTSDIYTEVSSIATVGVIDTVNSALQNNASDTYSHVSSAATNSFATEMANNTSATYTSVYGTATQAITDETQPSGIIDTAIQAAITP